MADISQQKVELEQRIPQIVSASVKEEITKIDTLKRNEALRYRYPNRVNTQSDADRKYMSDVPFSFLRRMAVVYPIARACINRRIRQITQLEWDITTIDELESETGYKEQIKLVKDFFKHPMGHKTRMRELLTLMVDDVLTVDAISFELQRTRGGDFMHLIPVDPTTIALRVTDTGGTPEPPETAYVQFIAGEKIAEFTTNEMLYEFMGNRSYSPYGLAPLESLIIQVESALRGALYNLAYFRESNVPEGFITLPEDVAGSKERVEEWQLWFDMLIAGDPKMQHRLKILPGGSEYTPAKKPEDMAFERFELWLASQTCMVFDVQPQDIGITIDINKATGESQSEIGRERGLLPLGNFLKEIFDDLIQVELQLEELQFTWQNINPVDRKEEIEIAEKEINMGTLGVDEFRSEQGREPLGLKAYVKTNTGPILVEDIVSRKVGPAADAKRADTIASQPKPGEGENQNQGNKTDEKLNEAEEEKKELMDLARWRKCVYRDLEKGKPLRTDFQSAYIDPDTQKEIAERLKKVASKFQAKILFDEYIDPEIKATMKLLRFSRDMRRLEHESSA